MPTALRGHAWRRLLIRVGMPTQSRGHGTLALVFKFLKVPGREACAHKPNRKDSIMRGRHPSGPEFVDKLEGLPEAKLRLKVVLETLNGTCRIQEACEQLGIKEARFDQLRIELLQAAVNAAHRRPAGRPARKSSAAEEKIRQLQERIEQLEADLQAALIRAELAVTLRNVGASAEKKTTVNRPATRLARGRPPQPKRSS
jgi:hypothetical protein